MDQIYSLSKYIAHAGICARRKAVELIALGAVEINGHIVLEPGYKVAQGDQVFVNGKKAIINTRNPHVYILLNKPQGYVSTVSDEKDRLTVLNLVEKKKRERLYPVGRLDIQTTGLLLLTNDGALAQRLAHPKFEIRKEYHVMLDRAVLDDDLKKIHEGMRFSDGKVKVDKVYRPASKPAHHVGIVLHSGKYHIIRRIFERLGYNVIKLDRVGYAGLTKKGLLKAGSWRHLTADEVKMLG